MRIGNLMRIFGLSAALILPIGLVACDDDDDPSPMTDASTGLGGMTGTTDSGTGGSPVDAADDAAGTPEPDAATTEPDADAPEPDASSDTSTD